MLHTIPKLLGVDLETTGSSFSDRIVEIAIILFANGKEELRWSTRINPGIPIPPETTAIHGIRDEDVQGKPEFGEVADKVFDMLEGAVLFGYNVIFDFNVLSAEMSRVGKKMQDRRKYIFLDPFFHMEKTRPKNTRPRLQILLWLRTQRRPCRNGRHRRNLPGTRSTTKKI